MAMIAGHTFVNDVCVECGRRWLDIHDVTIADLNKEGIAHAGALVGREIEEIVAEAQRRREALERAMGWHKPAPSMQTSEDMDSALRHGAPLRLKREDGWVDQGDGRWTKRVGPFYKNPGYYMWIGAEG